MFKVSPYNLLCTAMSWYKDYRQKNNMCVLCHWITAIESTVVYILLEVPVDVNLKESISVTFVSQLKGNFVSLVQLYMLIMNQYPHLC